LETLILEKIRSSVFLVTGAAGFIGSNLCEYLVNNGAKFVIGLDNLFNGKLSNIEPLIKHSKNFRFVQGDINDLSLLNKEMVGVDYVLHQAAWGSVPRSMKMPLEYDHNNVHGTITVFEAARNNKVKKVIYASSSSVYGDHQSLPKVEGTEGNILSPYALTKKMNELHGKIYWEVYNLPTIGLRYFNVFGRRQNPNGEYAAVIPRFINKLILGESPVVFGDGNQSRDFTYIDNVLQANIKACFFSEDLSFGKAFNIAGNEQVSINQLFETLKKYINNEAKLIYQDKRLGDILHSFANVDNSDKAFYYKPTVTFEEGIKFSIEWYKNQI
jgi:UDP-N-acetylglucosamine 4-epimerase